MPHDATQCVSRLLSMCVYNGGCPSKANRPIYGREATGKAAQPQRLLATRAQRGYAHQRGSACGHQADCLHAQRAGWGEAEARADESETDVEGV
jgi:hypothetical protein